MMLLWILGGSSCYMYMPGWSFQLSTCTCTCACTYMYNMQHDIDMFNTMFTVTYMYTVDTCTWAVCMHVHTCITCRCWLQYIGCNQVAICVCPACIILLLLPSSPFPPSFDPSPLPLPPSFSLLPSLFPLSFPPSFLSLPSPFSLPFPSPFPLSFPLLPSLLPPSPFLSFPLPPLPPSLLLHLFFFSDVR